MCSPSPPPAPDYTGAAEATAEGNLEASRAAIEANRYDQFTPLGDLTWTNLGSSEVDKDAYDAAMEQYYSDIEESRVPDNFPATVGDISVADMFPAKKPDIKDFTTEYDQDRWRSDITLSPEVQKLFDKGLMMQDISADIGLTAGEQIKDTFSTPFELDDFEGYREDVYDAMMSRLEEDISKDWDSRNAELYAAGIGRGTEAYKGEQTQRDRMLNDARLQAYQNATDQALRERGQTVQEAVLQRTQPLNEYNAWRTGAQVQLPSFQNTPPAQTVGGPDYLGAAQGRAQYDLAGYNADVAGTNNLLSGLFTLGAGYLMGPGGAAVAASDKRLKKDLIEKGKLESGIPVYEFSYLWNDDRYIGVLAQDVLKSKPDAVHIMDNGYYAVDYSVLK